METMTVYTVVSETEKLIDNHFATDSLKQFDGYIHALEQHNIPYSHAAHEVTIPA